MTALPARQIQEVLVRMDLEPGLADVYAEGGSDCAVMNWFFDAKGLNETRAFPADQIEIPTEDMERLGLASDSNKSRVLAIAALLEEKCVKPSPRVMCVADRDFDDYLGSSRAGKFLRYTDFTSLEMYYFNTSFLGKFLAFVLGTKPSAAESLRRATAKVLRRCYLMRLSNESLQWEMAWVDFGQDLRWSGVLPILNEDSFVRRYLRRNGRDRSHTTFCSTMARFERKLNADPRMCVRGHDYTGLLFRMNEMRGGAAVFADIARMERALLGYMETAYLDGTALFDALAAL